MKNSKIFITLLICISISLIAGCSNSPAAKPQEQNQIVYASTKDIRDINPHLYSGEMAAQNMVFESLVINTENGVQPWLAKSWDISEDGLEYIFYLREDVTFTDGAPFDAEAVKLNIDAIIENRGRHAWLDVVNKISNSEVIDEFTYKVTLKTPYYPFLVELGLTRPFRFISPNCFIDGTTKNGVKGYIGTGPWILTEHKNDQYAIFTANESYWGEKPKVDSVKWQVMPDHQTILLALEKGEIDILFGSDGDMIDLDSFEALQKQGKYAAVLSKPIASRAILLNAHQPITEDLKFREAMQYAVNKQYIADGILNGTEAVADTLISPSVSYCGVDLPVRSYDPEQANKLLDSIGWKMGDDGYRYKDNQKCEITLSYNSDNAQERTIGEYIQSNLKDVGVNLKIIGEEKQAFLDRQKTGEFNLQYSLSWGTPYDPQSYVSSWRIPAHGDYQAQLGIERKEWLDETITKLMAEVDHDKRQEMYTDILTYIHEECVYIPITYSRTKVVHNSKLKGVGFNESQYEIPFEKMYFE